MNIFFAELIGSMILTTLGCGVVAGVVLTKSKAKDAGWFVICLGWGLAVMFAIYTVGGISGAHLNPAVSIALVIIGKTPVELLPQYILGQLIGSFLGAVLVYFNYLPHWKATEDKDLKLAVFCTAPAIRNTFANFMSETIATFILMFGLMAIGSNKFSDGLNPLIICLLICSIGFSVGGTTGWAINPTRDFGPRLAHFLLPIPSKRDSDWCYAWIPIVAPILGAILGAICYQLIL